MKKVFFSLFFSSLTFFLNAQDISDNSVNIAPWADPSFVAEGKAQPRPEFISYEVRDLADRRNAEKTEYYLPLEGNWRVKYSNTAEGGVKNFSRRGYSVVSWDNVTVPNVDIVSGGKNSFAKLVPPQLPTEIPLVQYRAEIDVPYIWLDRDMFVQIENVGGAYSLYVNGKKVGYNEDTRTPAEFNISDYVTDGINSIGIEVYGYSTGSWMETLLPQLKPGSLGKVYVYSQPKLRVEDFVISTKPDTTGKHTWVDIQVILSNSYKGPEPITLGYDIYSPTGKLLTYNLFETNIDKHSHDTLYFREVLYNTVNTDLMWTPEHPTLYKMMIYLRRASRITEYIPLTLGLSWCEVKDGELWVNGVKADIRVVNYNAAKDEATTKKELAVLKKNKFNTIWVSYPQPNWFYDLCDQIGFYVVDQANINSGFRTHDRTVGGAVANNYDYLPAFIDRVAFMQGRSKNYASIIALSMGGKCGNGYNLYKAYQWLKQADSLHPIVYPDVQGEWNVDLQLPEAVDAADYLK